MSENRVIMSKPTSAWAKTGWLWAN